MSAKDPILTISVASKLLDIHPRTLMLYDTEGLSRPHRTNTKRRLYSLEDLEHLQFIKYLTQEEGLNLQGVKLVIKANEELQKNNIDFKKEMFPKYKASKLV